MAFSYSFHLSAKRHAVSTTGKVGEVDRHNLRLYTSNPDAKIVILRGDDRHILDSIKEIYKQEFDECLKRYNEGKRSDRQIKDYLKHVSDSRNDVAVEIIVQVGDKDFWDKIPRSEREQITPLFEQQQQKLERLVPELKIASAVIHYDETSPHMHVVGVPVASDYKKGMEKQVAKTKVFTAERLSELQNQMREDLEESLKDYAIFNDRKLKPKEKGRNKDIPKESLTEFYRMQRQIKEQSTVVDHLKAASTRLTDPKREKPIYIDHEPYYSVPMLQNRSEELQKTLEEQAAVKDSLTSQIANLERERQKEEARLSSVREMINTAMKKLRKRVQKQFQFMQKMFQKQERMERQVELARYRAEDVMEKADAKASEIIAFAEQLMESTTDDANRLYNTARQEALQAQEGVKLDDRFSTARDSAELGRIKKLLDSSPEFQKAYEKAMHMQMRSEQQKDDKYNPNIKKSR